MDEQIRDMWHHEKIALADGHHTICGVDEAGRGPLAGPVVAAAVVLPVEADIPGLDDSKKLTEKTREQLYLHITKTALSYAIAAVDHTEIDGLNILSATHLAMNRAMEKLTPTADFALIDGNQTKGITHPHTAIVGGDGKSASIAAASILAKVTRDRYMQNVLHTRYPQYGFDRHKGYPTSTHYQALETHGISPVHRLSFLQKWVEKPENKLGSWGERMGAQYLTQKGYTIRTHSWHCRYGEIDLVAEVDHFLVFVEVKTSKSDQFSHGRERVTDSKMEKLRKTAQLYLIEHDTEIAHLQPRFDVLEIHAPQGALTLAPTITHLEDAF